MRLKIFLISFITFLFSFSAYSQCRDFTEKYLIPELGDYLLNGRYHSFKMKEGDEILIFKTLNTGIKYKFIVGADTQLPDNIIFIVKDWNNKIIFDNRQSKAKEFEYQPDKAERIKIYIQIPQLNDPPHDGCVGLVIGMKKVEL